MAWHSSTCLALGYLPDIRLSARYRSTAPGRSAGAWRVDPAEPRYGASYTQNEVRDIVSLRKRPVMCKSSGNDWPLPFDGGNRRVLGALGARKRLDVIRRSHFGPLGSCRIRSINLEPRHFTFSRTCGLKDVIGPRPYLTAAVDERSRIEVECVPGRAGARATSHEHYPGRAAAYFTRRIGPLPAARAENHRLGRICRSRARKGSIVMSWHWLFPGAHAAAGRPRHHTGGRGRRSLRDNRQSALPTTALPADDPCRSRRVLLRASHARSDFPIQRHHDTGIERTSVMNHVYRRRVQGMFCRVAGGVRSNRPGALRQRRPLVADSWDGSRPCSPVSGAGFARSDSVICGRRAQISTEAGGYTNC